MALDILSCRYRMIYVHIYIYIHMRVCVCIVIITMIIILIMMLPFLWFIWFLLFLLIILITHTHIYYIIYTYISLPTITIPHFPGVSNRQVWFAGLGGAAQPLRPGGASALPFGGEARPCAGGVSAAWRWKSRVRKACCATKNDETCVFFSQENVGSTGQLWKMVI